MKLKIFSEDTILEIKKSEKRPPKKEEPKIVSRIISSTGSSKLKPKRDKPYKTVHVDHTKTILVKIDAKTSIQVPKGTDPDEARRKYELRMSTLYRPFNNRKH